MDIKSTPQPEPDQVVILRFWREAMNVWRVQVTDENNRILGWGEGTEQAFNFVRSMISGRHDSSKRKHD